MSVEIGLIVYKDSHNTWKEATNIAFINNHTCVKIIHTSHERIARENLKNCYSLDNDNEWFENYNHLREKG